MISARADLVSRRGGLMAAGALPHRYPHDPLPSSLVEMLAHFKLRGVRPVAYVYPILAFLAGTGPNGSSPSWIVPGTYSAADPGASPASILGFPVPSLYLPCTFPVPSLYLPCTRSRREPREHPRLPGLHGSRRGARGARRRRSRRRVGFPVPSLYLPCTFPVPSLYLPCTFPVPSLYQIAAASRRGPA
jgi:hypothetical protein